MCKDGDNCHEICSSTSRAGLGELSTWVVIGLQKESPVGLVGSTILANDTVHARQRKLLAHAFSAQALKEFDPILTGYFNLMIAKL